MMAAFSDREALADRWSGFVVVFIMAWVPLVAYLAPLGFAPHVGVAGLLALPLLWRERRLDAWPLAVLALLMAWMAISITWSPHQPKSPTNSVAFRLALQMLAGLSMISAFASLPREAARRGAVVLAVGVCALSVLLIADALIGARIYMAFKTLIKDPIRPDLAQRNIAQSTYVIALLFWPAAQVCARLGWRTAAFPIALMTAAIFASESLLLRDAPLFAVIAGGVVWLAVRWIGPAAARVLLVLAVMLFTLAPLLMLEGVGSGLIEALHRAAPESWDARLDIWAFAAAMTTENPLRGWGLDASRSFGRAIPLHPHNAALQVWLELGAPGAALFAALAGWIAASLAMVARTHPSQAAAGAGAMTAYLVIGSLSFGVWQEWWVALGCLTIAALAVVRRAWPQA